LRDLKPVQPASVQPRKWAASSQGRLAVAEQHLMTDTGSEYVVDLLKPG
jgi:hypothetical protein